MVDHALASASETAGTQLESRAPVVGLARQSPPRWLWGIVLAAFALRVAAIFVLRAWHHPNAIEHESLAICLLKGLGFSFGSFGYFGPSSVQSPTYPFLLAALFWCFGVASPAAYITAMVINAAFGAVAVWLVWRLAITLGANRTVALAAAAAMAVWPSQVYLVTHVQAIAMIVAGVLAIVILWYQSVRTARLGPWIGFSIIGTLAALTEPALLTFMQFSGLLVLFWRPLSFSVRLRNAAILLGVAILVIGPWSGRNRLVHHAWVPIKATFWTNVWKANNDFATGTDRLPMSPENRRRLIQAMFRPQDNVMRQMDQADARPYSMLTTGQLAQLHGQPEIAQERIFKRYAVAWIKSHPADYVRLCAIRLAKTLWLDWDNPKSYSILFVSMRSLLLALSILGLASAWRSGWTLSIPLLLFGSCLALYVLTITAARFSLPFEPFQMCLAAQFILSRTQAGHGSAKADRYDESLDRKELQPQSEQV